MSERLPYEMQLQQQWIDLPLPDENMAWADMKRRLEEDDDRPIIAWWRRGCAGWGALLLVLLAIGWWVVRPEKWFTKTTQQEIPVQKTGNDPVINTDSPSRTKTNTTARFNTTSGDQPTETSQQTDTTDGPVKNDEYVVGKDVPEITATGIYQTRTPGTSTSSSSSISTSGGGRRSQVNPAQPRKSGNDQRQQQSVPVVPKQPSSVPANTSIPDTMNKKDTLILDSAIIKKDPLKKDSVKKKEKPAAPVARTDSTKKKKIFFSAGLGEYQQIPLGGQKLTPYSASGRKGSLADYIPSVFFRINKENKWFIQTEFRYGAPQYTKELVYQSKPSLDTINTVAYTSATNATLKKTFYHQLPVTFNYYVLPNWSLGAGLAWNKFSSAISDVQIQRRRDSGGQDSIWSQQIVRVKNDSVFSNSYFQAVFETQYKWKRFSFGGRYMFGLQPYIKFTLPGGTRQEERNSSLQVFLRYELWRSKSK